MGLEDKIKTAIIEALKGVPELNGCLPDGISITSVFVIAGAVGSKSPPQIASLCYHVEFDVPLPIEFAGA